MRIFSRRWMMAAGAAVTAMTMMTARAEVKLPAILSKNMLVQADVPVRLWGSAAAGEEITVKLGGTEAAKVKAGADGRWSAELPAQKAGPVADIELLATNTLTLTNVLAGDVWICSGQSNMQFGTSSSLNGKDEVAAAAFPAIRLFKVPGVIAETPQDDCKGQWVDCSPATVANFSAVGFFFGRELQQKLAGRPMGLIGSNWGGTVAEAWTPQPALEKDPALAGLVKAGKDYATVNYPAALKKYETDSATWKKAADAAKAERNPTPRAPGKPAEPGKIRT